VTRAHVLTTWVVAVGVLVGAGCAASDDTSAEPAAPERSATEAPSPVPPSDAAGPSVADAITPLPPAAPLPTVVELPAPVSLAIEALDVAGAPVVAVGVQARGEMEVPGVGEVGWYRFGARPGDEGSAVLAAHISYDGVDGVFRHLADLAAGDTVSVQFADGAERAFRVTEVAQYGKSELPADVWARAGTTELVLITCGGEFDAVAGSYEDNVVAYATPA